MSVRPLGDRVLVKRDEAEKKTEGGIIIPDSATKKLARGVIQQIGTGKVQEDGSVRPLDVAVGDRVLFGEYSGTEITVEEEKLVILHEGDLFGVIEAES